MNENAKMTEENLYEYLKSLNVPLRMSDLKLPNRDFVTMVFSAFLTDLQINVASPLLRPFEAVSHLDNPELYEDAVQLILLAQTINEILGKDLSIKITVEDIVAPKPKRTKKIFYYMIVFWGYCLGRMGLFRTAMEDLQKESQEAETLKKENEMLQDTYVELVSKLKELKSSNKELSNVVASKEEKVKDLAIKREAVIEDYQALKEKENCLLTEISDIEIRTVTAKEKLTELDQLIITSPEKISADVLKLKDMIKEIDHKIREKEQDRKEKNKTFQLLQLAHDDFVRNGTSQQQILSDLQVLAETAQSLNSLHNKCLEEGKHLKDLQATQEMKESMANDYDQRAAKVQMSKNKQIAELTETHEMLQRQVSDEKKNSEKLSSSITELKNKIDKEVDSVIEIVDKLNEAKVAAASAKAQHAINMEKIDENLANDCKEILEEVQRVFGV